MVNTLLKVGVVLWRASAIMALFNAFVTALGGNAECFLWLVAAWVQWMVANGMSRMKGDQDGRTDRG